MVTLNVALLRPRHCHTQTLVECGSEEECKKRGELRIEGKEYVVQEGDLYYFVLMFK